MYVRLNRLDIGSVFRKNVGKINMNKKRIHNKCIKKKNTYKCISIYIYISSKRVLY